MCTHSASTTNIKINVMMHQSEVHVVPGQQSGPNWASFSLLFGSSLNPTVPVVAPRLGCTSAHPIMDREWWYWTHQHIFISFTSSTTVFWSILTSTLVPVFFCFPARNIIVLFITFCLIWHPFCFSTSRLASPPCRHYKWKNKQNKDTERKLRSNQLKLKNDWRERAFWWRDRLDAGWQAEKKKVCNKLISCQIETFLA